MSSKQADNKTNTIHNLDNCFYLAFVRLNYEGIYERSMKLFKNKTEAYKYISSLKEEHGNDFVTYDILEMYCQ